MAMIEVLTGRAWLNAETRARAELSAAQRIAYAIPDDGQGDVTMAKARRAIVTDVAD